MCGSLYAPLASWECSRSVDQLRPRYGMSNANQRWVSEIVPEIASTRRAGERGRIGRAQMFEMAAGDVQNALSVAS